MNHNFRKAMFKVGETVYYPGHGICTIKTIFDRGSSSGEGPTYILKPINATFKFQRLVLSYKKAMTLSVHHIIAKEDVPKIYEVLKRPPNDFSHNRIKGYLEIKEKLNSGDLIKIAEVARDLEALHDILSMLLKIRLMRKARKILTEEIANVENISKEEVESSINKTLLIVRDERENEKS